ncbi:MAG: hypothetical protein BWY64_04073 [bacterium ADurb.Bin363]|nr:MAG: hypothetical protein BWY64_04073 [bacterium ADurb.Bin363]
MFFNHFPFFLCKEKRHFFICKDREKVFIISKFCTEGIYYTDSTVSAGIYYRLYLRRFTRIIFKYPSAINEIYIFSIFSQFFSSIMKTPGICKETRITFFFKVFCKEFKFFYIGYIRISYNCKIRSFFKSKFFPCFHKGFKYSVPG